MVKTLSIAQNPNFIGRRHEWVRLDKALSNRSIAKMIVVHGRRRVGKTELIEQYFRQERVLKFEGLEGRSEVSQREHFLYQIKEYCPEVDTSAIDTSTWTALFKCVAEIVQKGRWVVYLEELQWMAAYRTNLVSELKFVWDNYLRRNNELTMVLCGSSPSFMISHVVKSKALHSRSLHELALKPLNLKETHEMIGAEKPLEAALDIYLSVGGIPEYLTYFQADDSAFKMLCEQSFNAGGYFVSEYDRLFVSTLGEKPIYKRIVDFLGQRKFATRNEILKALAIKSGADISSAMADLIDSGLVIATSPYSSGAGSKLVRCAIADEFLSFHAKFIRPNLKSILDGVYEQNYGQLIDLSSYRQWLGYALERLCRKKHHIIADRLGFSAVQYRSGPAFKRADLVDGSGFQIDLVYERKDRVFVVCEIKYRASKVDASVISQVESQIAKLNLGKKTVQKVLISPNGATQSLKDSLYFYKILEMEDLIGL